MEATEEIGNSSMEGMSDRPPLSMTIALIGIPRGTPVSVDQDGANHNRAQHGRSYSARQRGGWPGSRGAPINARAAYLPRAPRRLQRRDASPEVAPPPRRS